VAAQLAASQEGLSSMEFVMLIMSLMQATCPVHLISLHSITLIIFEGSTCYEIHHYADLSSLRLLPLHWVQSIVSLRPSYRVRNQMNANLWTIIYLFFIFMKDG
jgi:hypothetical protein